MSRTAAHITALTVMVFLVVAPCLAADPAPAKAARAGGPSAIMIGASDLRWNDVPDFPGVKMAALQGDPNAGAAHFFIKLPAGFSAPLHFHNPDHWVAVVSGTILLAPEELPEKRLGPGSGFGFTGKKRHTTKCAEGADCVLFVDARGKWDVVPDEKK